MSPRPVRTYPALLSTDADARAWARSGGPAGGVVVADYQASPRGRGGLPWTCRPGQDLCCSLLLRPQLTPDDEGWLFVAAAVGVADVLGGVLEIEWPDRILRDGKLAADVSGSAGLGAAGVDWAVVNVLIYDVEVPRGPLLGKLADAVERVQQPQPEALARYRAQCTTLGRAVVAHLIPTWPDGVQIAGAAVTVLEDGALVILEAAMGRRMAVRPQHLARLEVSDESSETTVESSAHGGEPA